MNISKRAPESIGEKLIYGTLFGCVILFTASIWIYVLIEGI
jgi:hypothetical protein